MSELGWWSILAGYVLGVLTYTWIWAEAALGDDSAPDLELKLMSLMMGAFTALFWPALAPFWHARNLINKHLRGPGKCARLERDRQRAEQEELRQLRRQVREAGLPEIGLTTEKKGGEAW